MQQSPDYAQFAGAYFRGAQIQGANFGGADLDGSLLEEVKADAQINLQRATLNCASLRALDLSSVNISHDLITGCFGDASVTLPGGVTPGHRDWPAHWPVWNLPIFGGDSDITYLSELRKWRADPAAYVPPPAPA